MWQAGVRGSLVALRCCVWFMLFIGIVGLVCFVLGLMFWLLSV